MSQTDSNVPKLPSVQSKVSTLSLNISFQILPKPKEPSNDIINFKALHLNNNLIWFHCIYSREESPETLRLILEQNLTENSIKFSWSMKVYIMLWSRRHCHGPPSRCNHEVLIGSTQPVKRSWRRARAERPHSLLDRPQPAQRWQPPSQADRTTCVFIYLMTAAAVCHHGWPSLLSLIPSLSMCLS